MTAEASADLIARIRRLRLVVFDFDGVFTDNTVYVTETGQEAVRCWRGDGLGLDKLRRLALELVVVSTETNPVVGLRCKKLRLACVQGCDDKRATVESYMAERNLKPEQVAYMGNDINDEACLEIAGLAVVPADAHPAILPLAHFRTTAPGGRGAVREFCDLVDRFYRP